MRTTAVARIMLFSVMCVSVTRADLQLWVNGQATDSITLEVGQSCAVQLHSDDNMYYAAGIGFGTTAALGTFVHAETRPEAGALAYANEWGLDPEYPGYTVSTFGFPAAPSSGIHFVFSYTAVHLGETDLELHDQTQALLDSVHIFVVPPAPVPVGTAFTYQGHLSENNAPANGVYDLEFALFHHPSDGQTQVGETHTIDSLEVIDGIFSVPLDFGTGIFAGDARWLQISVRPGELEDPNAYNLLSPRQEVTPTPYALHAATAADIVIESNSVISISGDRNLFVGVGAGENNTGKYVTCVGHDAGRNNQDDFNTFLGAQAGLSNTTGDGNVFLGTQAGYHNTTGYSNTFVGSSAGWVNITGWGNTFLGTFAGRNTVGFANTFIGRGTGYEHTTGYYNTFVGAQAGYSNTTGIKNTILGRNAGLNSTGSGSVFIGYEAGYNETASEKLYIANDRNDSQVLIYGDFSAGIVGIRNTDPVEALDVAGAVRLGTTGNTNAGTIRWTGTDFEGYDGSQWVSLTSSSATSHPRPGYDSGWFAVVAHQAYPRGHFLYGNPDDYVVDLQCRVSGDRQMPTDEFDVYWRSLTETSVLVDVDVLEYSNVEARIRIWVYD